MIELDRQRRRDAEKRKQLVSLRERLPARNGLRHPPERDTRTFAFEHNGNDARPGLETDLTELQRCREDERRTEHGMACEGQFQRRSEDPNPRMAAGLGRQNEHGLGEAHLKRKPLHGLVVDSPSVREDGQLVAAEETIGEDVELQVPV